MEAYEQSYKRAEQLYSLAHLFTGDSELSVNLALETIDLDSASETIFAVELHGSSRKRFIAKILAAIRGGAFYIRYTNRIETNGKSRRTSVGQLVIESGYNGR